MGPRNLCRRILAAAAGFVAAASLLAGCGSSPPPKPVVGGLLGFDRPAAALANGVVPSAVPDITCGSSAATFGTELLETNPNQAKVNEEWGEPVPGARMMVSGRATSFQFSRGDLPFTHPFGNDVTLDIRVDGSFGRLVQLSGTPVPAGPLQTLHFELSSGLWPHLGPTSYLPGFIPQEGDRLAAIGHWVVDCGHSDFHTELHPPSFVSFAHQEGSATVSHAFAVPYFESQLYTPIPSLVNDLGNAARLTDQNSLTFPQYLVQELLRVGHLGPKGALCCDDRLRTHMLIQANTFSTVTWYVCAPGPRPAGATLADEHRFVARPGVTIAAAPDPNLGCVRYRATMSPAYRPIDPARRDCVLPWEVLDQQARDATGVPDLSVKKGIEKLVPPSFLPRVDRNPIVDCYDPLVVPDPAGAKGGPVVTSATQPFPFYGFARVSWRSSP